MRSQLPGAVLALLAVPAMAQTIRVDAAAEHSTNTIRPTEALDGFLGDDVSDYLARSCDITERDARIPFGVLVVTQEKRAQKFAHQGRGKVLRPERQIF